ncbi:MAG: hypothetical protein JW768_06415 [Chitinispirillaceae bacterium]|nr:hypothetical protein [Chitinispirillaceae bacterium]
MSCISTIRNNRGSAIMLVMAIGAVVSFMVFAWVIFSVKRSHAVIHKRDLLHARYAAESAVSKAVYERRTGQSGPLVREGAIEIVRSGDTASTCLTDSTVVYTDSLRGSKGTATTSEEGSFLRVVANGTAGREAWDVDALFGQELTPDYRFALIVSEQNKQLDVRSGKVIGDIKVSKAPLGAVEGRVDAGTIVKLPPVDEQKLVSGMLELETKISLPEQAQIVFQGSQAFDERTMPRLGDTAAVFVNGHVLITGGSLRPLELRGPSSIIATGDIQVSGNVSIHGVELIALGQIKCFDQVRMDRVILYSQDMIYFDDEVRYSGNMYAFKTITLAGQSTVDMPSFGYVKGVVSNDPKSMNGLQLMQESRYAGIFFCAKGATCSIVERYARFTGLLYTRGFLVLEGTVFGCVAAAQLKTAPEDDRNRLAGGLINRRILPKRFMVPLAFGRQGAPFRLVSWIEAAPREGLERSEYDQ